jgi:hypothetical protein
MSVKPYVVLLVLVLLALAAGLFGLDGMSEGGF